jgi:hypothetical protein
VNAIDQGLIGLRGGFGRLDDAANRIARGGADDSLADNMVELVRARADVRTNVAVLRSADDMIGSILDVFV